MIRIKATFLIYMLTYWKGLNLGIKLPEQPTLWYACDSQNFQLKNDSDLMKMFNSFADKKLINMAIGSGESACKNLELARRLIK